LTDVAYCDSQSWKALQRLDAWLVRTDYKAYDPFDGLSSWLRVFTLRKALPQRMLQQFVRRNPFNLRPLIGITPHRSTKGMGFLGGAYLKLHALTGEEQYRDRARWCFDWLIEHQSTGYSGSCWGNAFDYISRGSYIPRGAPTIVWSGLIGHNFVEAYRALGDTRYLDIARSVCAFIMKDLPRIPAPVGVCLSYVTDGTIAVHNSNLLGARLLAEVYKETGDGKYRDLATEAVRYSAAGQLPNGAWYYGEEPKFHWIDNWHTAYNLDAILDYQRNAGSNEFDAVISRGLEFYLDNFFTEEAGPKYYAGRVYRYDIQSASQSIDTLALFGTVFKRNDLLHLATRVAGWTIDKMQDPEGYFYLWKSSSWTNTTPTFHWGGATMLHALAHLLLALEQSAARLETN
jgi:hypothetical protein